MKRALISAPVLAFPYFEEQFLLYVDASSTAIGLALAQVQNGKEVVIAYNGRGLNQAERNYTTTEREALALVEGIKKFQLYLHDRKFVVSELMYTDHSSLRWLMNVKDATGRLARWALLLQQYNFDIIHRPGCQNGNADALSRRPYPNTSLNALQQCDPEIDEVREKQRKDPELSEIIDYIQHDSLPSNDAKAWRILLRSDCFNIGQDGQPLFEIGQRVWVYTPKTKMGLSKKLLYNWFGPYRTVEQSSPVHYRLRSKSKKKVTFAVHANRMKPFVNPALGPFEPPNNDDPSEPYLDELDIPADSFEPSESNNQNSDTSVTVENNTRTQIISQGQPDAPDQRKDDNQVVIDTQTIFAAEKILKRRKRKGKLQ